MPRKKYDTPHRSRVVKTRMTEEELRTRTDPSDFLKASSMSARM